jgi:hypothetical protein
MNARWQDAPRARPDPYVDWEYRTRRLQPDPCDVWCSVHIEVRPDQNGHYLPALLALRDATDHGRLAEDEACPGRFTIRMSDEERIFLRERTLAHAKHDKIADPVEVQFFVYRLESLIYHQGRYRDTRIYRTLMAWPPIVGLKINEDINPEPLPIKFDQFPLAAKPTAIGIIDDAIAFAHERFRAPSNTSRVAAMWLQDTERRRAQDLGVLFGQRLDNDCINALLKCHDTEDAIYRELGVTDFGHRANNPLAARASHGTHVLDLAAGHTPDGSTTMIDHPIFAVQLPSAATVDTSGVTMGSYVLQAVRMIMHWADHFKADQKSIPLVINFSYGLLASAKDGTQYLEQALTRLIHYRNYVQQQFTRLVLPAGNSYRGRETAKVTLKPEPQNLDWVVLPDDATPNFIEIWLDDPACDQDAVALTLTLPGESRGYCVQLEECRVSELASDQGPIAAVYYDAFPGRRRARVLIAVGPTGRNDDGWARAPSGRWNIALARRVDREITAHLYVQRDDAPFGYARRGRQSRLDHPDAYARDKLTGDYRDHTKSLLIYEETLSAIATTDPALPDHIVVVGAAVASDHAPPADYTASGPTKLRKGPDCAAFADGGDAHWGMLAAGTFSGSVVAMRGTSVAAPQIARALARLQTDFPNQEATIPVHDPLLQRRLGDFIQPPAPNREIPRRRYPAV